MSIEALDPDTWSELQRRMFGFSRDLIKQYAMMISYGRTSGDPWIDHIIVTEVRKMLRMVPA